MHRIRPDQPHPLHDTAATRRIELAGAAHLPAHTLMQRAGLAVARLARALAPHARTIWIACGPGNNGGDGLEAAMHLHQQGLPVVVTWLGAPESAPADALRSWQRAQQAGVQFTQEAPSGLGPHDLCIDALLGIGLAPGDTRPAPQGRLPGSVWLDDLGCDTSAEPHSAWLSGPPAAQARTHASHKGSYGDVAVIGGEGLQARGMGMTGAALLAASAALHAGAGRVLVALLGGSTLELDVLQPELMFRHIDVLPMAQLTVVCGCGGGDAVRAVLPRVLALAQRLVLDADALNAVATDGELQQLLTRRAAWIRCVQPPKPCMPMARPPISGPRGRR